MPFPSILSTEQLTQLRQSDVTHQQYVLFTPNDVVWQTQPNAQVDGAIPYAEIVWNGTVLGDRADVKQGMTVLISTSSVYRDTTIFRGRVRKTPDGTTFFVDENSTNLETSYYITVIDDFDVHEKQERRLINGTRYIDYDKSFSKLPPVISGLQSVYVDVLGAATAIISFAPTVTAIADGATIIEYLWDVGDGTITVGTSATKDITVSFPGTTTNEHRWVMLTATDSNYVSQYFVFEVYTIDLASTSSIVSRLGTNAVSITGTQQDGFNVTVRVVEAFDTVLNRTRCTILSIDDYDGLRSLPFTSGGTTPIEVGDDITGDTSGAIATVVIVDLDSGSWAGGDAAGTLWINNQSGIYESENLDVGVATDLATIAGNSINPPITQNVSFVGRLNRENNITTGDEIYSTLKESQITIEGFSAQIGRMHGAGIYLVNSTSPTQWGEIKTMTVGRAVIYMLAWYSTFLNVCSLSLPSDINDYAWDDYSIQPEALRSWITSVTDDINAYMIFAASGECTIARHASYAGVGGLDTIMDFKINSSGVSDILEFSLDLEYIETTSSAIIGAATYNTTLGTSKVFQGRAPSQVYGPGWETAPINQQIMKSDLTETQARTEAGNRVSSHLAFNNPKARMNVRLPSGYYWLVPSDDQLYSFDIAAADNLAGRVFTSSDKWLCVEVSYSYDNGLGAYEVNAAFEEVTTGGNYGIVVTQVILVSDLSYPDLPPLGAGLALNDLLANYSEVDPGYTLAGSSSSEQGPGNQQDAPAGCDVLNVNMRSGATVTTHNNTVNGETYIITVNGDGVIGEINSDEIIYMLNGNGVGASTPTLEPLGGGALDPLETGAATWVAGGGALADYYAALSNGNLGNACCNFVYPVPEGRFVKSVFVSFWGARSGTFPVGNKNCGITLRGPSGDVLIGGPSFPGGSYASNNQPRTRNEGIDYASDLIINQVFVHCSMDSPVTSGSAWVTAFNVTLRDPRNVRGDAFYTDYDDEATAVLYTGVLGLVVNAAKPGNIPLYTSNHEYQFTYTGDGSPIQFKYNDVDYSDNDNVNLVVTVCGPGMAITQL